MHRNFLIVMDFYPYYRLPSTGELETLSLDAKEKYLDAQKKQTLYPMLWTEIFFKMQDINRDDACIVLTTQDKVVELPTKGAPRRLKATDFDKSIGKVMYPVSLSKPIYDYERCVLNNKLKDFCTENPKMYITYEKVQVALYSIENKFKDSESDTNNTTYWQSVNFIHSLEYEVRKLI
jgi:hypothetical protein